MRVNVKAGQSSKVVLDQAERRVIRKFLELAQGISKHSSDELGGLAGTAADAAVRLNNYLESLEPKCPTTEAKPDTVASAAPIASQSSAAS